MARRDDREAQAEVLRAVLQSAPGGLTDAELATHCESLDPSVVESATESLLASGLLIRRESRLHAAGPATRFNRLIPL
jgi:predicted transcriptional regulator